jgi:Armadillo/beta-catenin-like repeat
MTQMSRADDLAGALASGEANARLKSLRAIKNSVIGSKREKTKHLLYLPIILEILSNDKEADVLIQAAQAIGSFAAAPDGAKAVIDQGGVRKLLAALKHPDLRVVEASARALKLLYTKTVDISVNEVQQVLQTPGATTALVALLSSQDSPSIGESAAWIISRCCEVDPDAKLIFCNAGVLQPLVQSFQDSSQRNKQAAALAAITALTNKEDVGTCKSLLEHQNVAFDLLKCVKSSKENSRMKFTACVCLTNLIPALPSRLASGSGASSGGGAFLLPSREDVQETVLPVLVRLMSEESGSQQHMHSHLHHREKPASKQRNISTSNSILVSRPVAAAAPPPPPLTTTKLALANNNSNTVAAEIPSVLLRLLNKNPALQAEAVDADAILHVSKLLKSENTCFNGKISSLMVLGMLTESVENHRRKLVDCEALPAVAAALTDPNIGVRAAACCCMRSLSRSARMIRCNLNSISEIAIPLLELSKHEDSTISTEAAATLANIAIEYSSMKEQVLVLQGITRFVELTEVENNKKLQLYGVWGLSSAVYLSSDDVKTTVMKALRWNKVVEFLKSDDQDVKEKTLLLLRNLAHRGGGGGVPAAAGKSSSVSGDSSITVLEWSQGHFLPTILEALNSILEEPQSLQSSKVKQFENALYAVVNIASGHPADKDAVANLVMSDLKPAFEAALHHEQESIREAAVWVVINLTYIQDGSDGGDGDDNDESRQRNLDKRKQDLISMGAAEDLRVIRNEDPSMRVRERADTAWLQLTGGMRRRRPVEDERQEEGRTARIRLVSNEDVVIDGRRVPRGVLFNTERLLYDDNTEEEDDAMDEDEEDVDMEDDGGGEGLPW